MPPLSSVPLRWGCKGLARWCHVPWLCPPKLVLGTSRHHAEGCAPLPTCQHSPGCLLPRVPAAIWARVSPGLRARGSSCSPLGFQGCWGCATQPRCLPVPSTRIHSINLLGEQGQEQGGLSVCLSVQGQLQHLGEARHGGFLPSPASPGFIGLGRGRGCAGRSLPRQDSAQPGESGQGGRI